MAIAIDFAKLSDSYSINCLNGTWTSRTISGQDCLTMVQSANANNNGFILIPTNITVDAYTIIGLSVSSETTDAFLIDANSEYGRVGGYDDFGGFRTNSGITRPDLRGIRLQGSSGLTPNYSGNINGNQINWNSNFYNAFGYYTASNLPLLIYLPSFVTNIQINDQPLITYTWSSVPAISGKNGILSLMQIKPDNINDGNAVNDATSSYFSNAPNTGNVGDIITSLQPIVDGDPTKVAVKYTIPDLTDTAYTSVKLVAKKNKIPKNKTDGDKIIDLSPSSGGVVVSGLEQLTKYYFVIFVEDSVGNKADSEPKSITTGKKDGIFKMRITTSQGVKDSDFKEVIEVTRV